MKLWLDDERPPPNEAWTWVKTADEAIETLRENVVSFASLDHDLGDVPDLEPNQSHNEKTGYTVVLWMAEHDVWPTDGIEIHSWNLVGGGAMRAAVDRYGPYSTRCRHLPFQTTDIGQV